MIPANMIFPVWFVMYLLPWTGMLIILLANLIIDSIVFLLSTRSCSLSTSAKIKSILKVWLCGFLADLIGSFIALGLSLLSIGTVPWLENFTQGLMYDPYVSPAAVIVLILLVIFCGWLIWLLDSRLALRSLPVSNAQKRKTALWMAVLTAPYLFLASTAWFIQI